MPKKIGTVIDGFLIVDAAKYSLLTVSMIDYLCREKVLVPTGKGRRGRGNARKYSFGDVVMLRILGRLLNSGVSVQRLKKALQAIRQYHKDISPEKLPAQYLVTDGTRIYLCDDKRRLLDLDGTEQMSFFFVLELADAQQEVLRAVQRG